MFTCSSSKTVYARVKTMDRELEFPIQPSTKGKQIFDQVVETIGLQQLPYFGLQYVDSKGDNVWLKLENKVLSQDVKKDETIQFLFRVKYYPENVTKEIRDNVATKLLFLQVKNAIQSREIYCPLGTSDLLTSYDEDGAMMEYLQVAQGLDMYGVQYFEIKNKDGTDLFLGVDSLGMNIYEKENKLTPKIGLPWGDIRNISYLEKTLVIKPIDKKAPDFKYFTSSIRVCKRIVALCIGNHTLYMVRRRP